MRALLREIRACRVCEHELPFGPRPIVQAHPEACLLIIGQAPGLKAHESGVPWNDASGDRLREWLGLTREIFYDQRSVAVVPMGFCYPGRAKSGDAPPRKECFGLWHGHLLQRLKNIRLSLLVGNHAQGSYLGPASGENATETIRRWREYLPHYLPLPHPSPRNNIWLSRNPWFAAEVLPEVRRLVAALMDDRMPSVTAEGMSIARKVTRDRTYDRD